MRDESLLSDKDAPSEALHYPFAAVPGPGEARKVADGVYWLRMPMPMRLDHINLWLLEDGAGYAIVDSGLNTAQIKDCWRRILAEFVGEKPITRIIVTHMHPDHAGLAGWLHKKTGAPVMMTRTEYLTARLLCLDVRPEPPEHVMAFFKAAGFSEDQLDAQRARGWGNFARAVTALPDFYHKLEDGQTLRIGRHDWRIVVGRGHSPEHACLLCQDLGVMISGDQVLPRISSNVSVYATEPEANPLGDWLDSLECLKALPADLLVLPAHNEPFEGLRLRLDGLMSGHFAKLERLLRTLDKPCKATDTLNTLFGRKLEDPLHFSMATGESLAHLRFLEAIGMIRRWRDGDVDYYQASDQKRWDRTAIAERARKREERRL